MPSPSLRNCSFCGRPRDEVKRFISRGAAAICGECVSLCNGILAEEEAREAGEPRPVRGTGAGEVVSRDEDGTVTVVQEFRT